MRPYWRSSVLLVASVIGLAGIDAVYAEQPAIQCSPPRIQATFKATLSTYHVTTSCSSPSVGFVNWESHGSYDPSTGIAREDVQVGIANAYSATATTTLTCPSDPWLGPPFGAGKVACSNGTFNTSGQVNEARFWLDWLGNGFSASSLPNSTGFNYDRPALIAQRDAGLSAEAEAAAALQQHNQRILKKVKPGPAVVAPTIVLPALNALFLENTTIPIKLLPPQGMQVVSFMLKLERRDNQGNWVVFNNIPVGVAEATSLTGYTGWGAPANGKGPGMIAGRGSYRVSAQVLVPQPTRWSVPVEFSVTTPSKAIQRGPQMFSPNGLR